MTDDGLRVRKKLATKRDLAEVSFKLAIDRGLDGFIIDDVVKQAGYSRRTFANYFSCKEEAVVSSLALSNEKKETNQLVGLVDQLTPLEAIEFFIKKSFSLNKLNHLHQLIKLSRDFPSLSLYVHAAINDLQIYARESMNQAYKDTYSKEYYYLLIGAVFGALMPLLEGQLSIDIPNHESESGIENEFNQYIDKTFSFLRKGFE
ncbi:TetR/AcrR family transcriptional regulator [Alkalicoccobacillus gibsonii]|uniref:TetR/AcrR family transcriptional regulator n=1 Tax=Alkalicoccobacillus gibsonii TaxID=79881 RepID=A0ABU9VDU9_9BACI